MQLKLTDAEIENIFDIFFKKYRYNRDDFYGVAAIGFTKALSKFDDSKNTKFCTYAIACMRTEVLFELRKWRQTKRYLDSHAESLEKMITEDGLTLGELVADDEIKGIDSDVDTKNALDKIRKILSKKEFEILKLKMMEMADKDIARALGLPENVVTSIQKNFKYNPKIVEVMYSLELI